MDDLAAEARIAREREYHNRRYTEETRMRQQKYYAAIWHGQARFEARLEALIHGADVLEYGCGESSTAFRFAKACRSVIGIDISDIAITHANELAAAENFGNIHFEAMNAEEMTFDDCCFDLIYGRGILHHLSLPRCFAEIARVMRPSGVGLFWEPLGHNVLINGYRKLTPGARTSDEHPLLKQDFDIARRHFEHVEVNFYGLTTLATVPFRNSLIGSVMLNVMATIDRALFLVPSLKYQAWYCTLELRGPRKHGSVANFRRA